MFCMCLTALQLRRNEVARVEELLRQPNVEGRSMIVAVLINCRELYVKVRDAAAQVNEPQTWSLQSRVNVFWEGWRKVYP